MLLELYFVSPDRWNIFGTSFLVIYYCKVKKEDDESVPTNERRGWLDKLLLLLSCEDWEQQPSCSTLDGLTSGRPPPPPPSASQARSWTCLSQGPTLSLPSCRWDPDFEAKENVWNLPRFKRPTIRIWTLLYEPNDWTPLLVTITRT